MVISPLKMQQISRKFLITTKPEDMRVQEPIRTEIQIHKGKLCSFWINEDDIFCVRANDRLVTEEFMEHDFALIRSFLKETQIAPPIFYDASELSPINKRARQMLESFLEEQFTSLAVISRSRVGMAIANIFFGLSKSSFPKKIFMKEENALEWLKVKRRYQNEVLTFME